MQSEDLYNDVLSVARGNLLAYFQTHDPQYIAEDAVYRNMNTGETYTGRAEIGAALHYFYHVIFDAKAEMTNYIITENKAMVEGYVVGRHTGALSGIPATGKDVRFPLCVTYELKDGLISEARIYTVTEVLLQQLGVSK